MIRARFIRTLVLAAWAGFFAWLVVSGAMFRYVGSRTYWVVWAGLAILGIVATADAVIALRTGRRGHIASVDVRGALWLLIPIAVVILIPEPTLGSLAASRKATGGAATTGLTPPSPSADISFQEIEYASTSSEYAAQLGLVEGYEVELVGFVDPSEDDREGTFRLTRFEAFCCAADAMPHSVVVHDDDAATYPPDSWVRVEGKLIQAEGRWVVAAGDVTEVEVPRNPYL